MEEAVIKIKDIADEYAESNGLNAIKARQAVNDMIKKLGIKTQKIGPALYIPAERERQLRVELSLPDELQIKFAWAYLLHDAANKNFVFAKVEGYPNKHAVQWPRRKGKPVKGKRFKVEVIEDKEGVSFRHEWFHQTRATR